MLLHAFGDFQLPRACIERSLISATKKKKNVSAPMADMERVFIDIDTVLCVTGVIKNSIAQQKHWQIFRKKKKKTSKQFVRELYTVTLPNLHLSE